MHALSGNGFADSREQMRRYLSRAQPAASLAIDDQVLGLWCAGNDTAEIARMLGEPEALIASRVPRVLQRRRSSAA